MLGENEFAARHIGVSAVDLPKMLEVIGVASLDELIEQTVPGSIRQRSTARSRAGGCRKPRCCKRCAAIAAKNKMLISMIGQGYYGTIRPR